MVGRNLDLQRIRKEQKVTQQRLAELTQYPQSYISQIENGKALPPQQFLVKLQALFGIEDLEPYFIPTPEEQAVREAISEVDARISEQQSTINRLLDMLERRDERVRELEAENKRLLEIMLKRVDD